MFSHRRRLRQNLHLQGVRAEILENEGQHDFSNKIFNDVLSSGGTSTKQKPTGTRNLYSNMLPFEKPFRPSPRSSSRTISSRTTSRSSETTSFRKNTLYDEKNTDLRRPIGERRNYTGLKTSKQIAKTRFNFRSPLLSIALLLLVSRFCMLIHAKAVARTAA